MASESPRGRCERCRWTPCAVAPRKADLSGRVPPAEPDRPLTSARLLWKAHRQVFSLHSRPASTRKSRVRQANPEAAMEVTNLPTPGVLHA